MSAEQNDDFLHRLHEQPRPEFARALAARLTSIAPEPRRGPRALGSFRGRRAALTATAVAAVLTLLAAAVALPFLGGSDPVSAQSIVNRATSATTGPTSYHLRATERQPGPAGASSTVSSETWSKPGDFFRYEETVTDARGAVVRRGGVVDNPTSRTKFLTENGQTHYGTFSKTGGEAVPPRLVPGSFEEFLAQLGQKNCGQATRQADGTLLNRPVYVVDVAHAGCESESKPGGPPPPSRTRLWVDKETFVVLKSESVDGSGAVQARYTVDSIEVGVSLSDSVFVFTPPPGATRLPEPESGGPSQRPKPPPVPSASPRP